METGMVALDRQVTDPEIIRGLRIEKLVFQGYGLAHKNGKTVFVTGAVPGDILDAVVEHRKADVLIARTIGVSEPSSMRITPPCPVFGECGGCDWLMMPYSAQLQGKHALMRELLKPLGVNADEVPAPVPSPCETHYRNKSYLPIATGPVIGMYARRTHRVIPHPHCQLQPDIFDTIAQDVLSWITVARVPIATEGSGALRFLGLRQSNTTGEIVMSLVSRTRKIPFTKQLERCLEGRPVSGGVLNLNPHPGNVILGEEDKILWGSPRIRETLCGHTFEADYRAFFQVNPGQAENLHRFAAQQVNPGDTVIDAYCGVGTFGIHLATNAARVIGIESNPNAVLNASANAEANGATNCTFIEGKVEDVLPGILSNTPVDVLLVDPPRKGLERSFMPSLQHVRRIVYVSCNPATQMRDVRALIDAGFVITTQQSFDMFPQTSHIESAIVLERSL
jgi:23S rRNA (uracil1939-C5)-methyltransferase